MQATATFGYEQIVTELIRVILDTVADIPGLSPERRAVAQQTAVCSVMAYNPRDPIETMMAGQCIVYDHLMRDGARDMLRGQAELIKIKARPGILSAGKMFLATMEMLSRMQGRAADQLAFARKPEAQPEPAAPSSNEKQPIVAQSPARPIDAGIPRPAAAPSPGAQPPAAPSSVAAPTAAPSPAAPSPAMPAPAARPSAAPQQAAPSPAAPSPAARPVPSGPPDAASIRGGAPTPSANQPPQSGRPTNPQGAPPIAPERRQDALVTAGPASPTLLPAELIEEILLNGLDPIQKQEIRDAVARATRGAI